MSADVSWSFYVPMFYIFFLESTFVADKFFYFSYWSFLAVTLTISSPFIQRTALPEHLEQVQVASTGFVNQTLLANLAVLSVNAPTGQTSITFPIKSLSKALLR